MSFATSSWAQEADSICYSREEALQIAKEKESLLEQVEVAAKEYKRLEAKYELTDSLRELYYLNYNDQIDITALEIKNGKKKGRRGWLVGLGIGVASGLAGGLIISR